MANLIKNWKLKACAVLGHGIGNSRSDGFTLVELIVSLTIASILMVGLSTFFSSTFRNLFQIQTQSANTARQFATNEIVRNKFLTLKKIISDFSGAPTTVDEIIMQTEVTKNQLPFSYIGATEINGKNYLAFKDFFVFNKIFFDSANHIYGDSGEGELKKENGVTLTITPPKNFAGFVKMGSDWYVALPDENAIVKCDPNCGDPIDLGEGYDLSYPVDIETVNTNLYISDSGNNRIIRYDVSSDDTEAITGDFNFPTGLSHYNEFLFVADTFNHKIKKINLSNGDIETIAGDGDNNSCDKTAKFCKLNLPTGLSADDANHTLFVSDSGNNRILKIFDPPISNNLTSLQVEFELDEDTKISKIDFIFPQGSTLGTVTENSNNLHPGIYPPAVNTTQSFVLKTIIEDGNATRNVCVIKDEIETCKIYFDRFTVLDENFIFNNDDTVILRNDTYTVDNADDQANTVSVVDNENEESYPPGTIVKIDNTFDTKDADDNPITYKFDLNLSNGYTFPEGFQNVNVEVYDDENKLVAENTGIFLIGDEILGSSEDQVKVFATGLNFPTGISATDPDLYVSDSLESEVKHFDDGSLQSADSVSLTYYSIDSIGRFDYISDFELEVDGINFTKYNNETILELKIDAKTDENNSSTYKINTEIPTP